MSPISNNMIILCPDYKRMGSFTKEIINTVSGCAEYNYYDCDEDIITLPELSKLQHEIGQGIRICICDSEYRINMKVLFKYDMDFFKEISKVITTILYKW